MELSINISIALRCIFRFDSYFDRARVVYLRATVNIIA